VILGLLRRDAGSDGGWRESAFPPYNNAVAQQTRANQSAKLCDEAVYQAFNLRPKF
jgi:hypothetical protein